MNDCKKVVIDRRNSPMVRRSGERVCLPVRDREQFLLTEGKVVVQMDLSRNQVGSVLVTYDSNDDLSSDTGTVVEVGAPLSWKGREVAMPEVGSIVLVIPKHGKAIENDTSLGDEKNPAGTFRFFGCAGGFSPYSSRGDKRHPAQLTPWWWSIPLILNEQMDPNEFQPTGDWVLLRHQIKDRTDSGIILPDSAFIDPRATCTAEIMAVGPLCKEITDVPEPGNQFYYWEGAAKHVLGLDRDYVLVREPFVLGQKL